ncbi:low molecular weight phosphatase family protein [Mariniluteicoccus endophyticus]
MQTKPCVLFVCVKNGGKSQMAAALMRQLAGNRIEVHSAGTNPGSHLNSDSVASLREVGASVDGEYCKPIDPDLLARADRVVVLGREAKVDPVPGMRGIIETWDTDEPSERGIDGADRMRIIRDDISARVRHLEVKLTGD